MLWLPASWPRACIFNSVGVQQLCWQPRSTSFIEVQKSFFCNSSSTNQLTLNCFITSRTKMLPMTSLGFHLGKSWNFIFLPRNDDPFNLILDSRANASNLFHFGSVTFLLRVMVEFLLAQKHSSRLGMIWFSPVAMTWLNQGQPKVTGILASNCCS